MKLYDELATDFSNSRAYPWKGWGKVKEYVESNFTESVSVLDLGCGNGRFLQFLIDQKINFADFVGIDSSDELLKIAKERYSDNAEFIFADLETDWETKIIEEIQDPVRYDVIVLFGVMHHISSFEKRVEILRKARSKLKENGVIMVTYWQFGSYPRFTDKAENLGNNDYMLSFNGESGARFCHFTDEREAEKIEEDSNCELISSYYSDGGDEKLNLYRFYK